MGFDGNGTFVRTNGLYNGAAVWASDLAAGVNIVSDRHDTHDQDIANGINNLLYKDGTTAPRANLPMATFKHTAPGVAVDGSDYARTDDVQDGGMTFIAPTGTADAIELDVSPKILSYTPGQVITFIATATNTGSVTIAVNGLEAVPLFKRDGTIDLVAGDIQTGSLYRVVYDPTITSKFILLANRSALGGPDFADDAVTIAKIEDDAMDGDITFDGLNGPKIPTTAGIDGGSPITPKVLTTPINEVATSSGGFNVELPAISGHLGKIFSVSNNTVSTLTIHPNGSETIAGDATAPAATGETLFFIPVTATNWAKLDAS
jgi:hypothetical protein